MGMSGPDRGEQETSLGPCGSGFESRHLLPSGMTYACGFVSLSLNFFIHKMDRIFHPSFPGVTGVGKKWANLRVSKLLMQLMPAMRSN